MDKGYDTMLEDEEFQIVEKFDLPKKESLVDPVYNDIFYEEEELNFD